MTSQDPIFEYLVKADIAGQSAAEDAAWLRSDETIVRFVDFLTYLEAELTAQIEAFDMGLAKHDVEWRRSTNLFLLRIRARLAEVRPLREKVGK